MPVRRRNLFRCLVLAAITAASIAGESRPIAAQQQKQKRDRAKGQPRKSRGAATGVSKAVEIGDATWPQFLGPGRDNISRETGLLRKWPSAGPRLVSTMRGLGVGFSNIAVDRNTIYTMGNFGEREVVLAVSLETGETVWKHDNAGAYHNGYGDGPRGTPTLDGDRLYALGASGTLVCLESKTGRVVWQKNLRQEFGTAIPNWGLCESVLIDGDRAVCTPGGKGATMVAFDKHTGAIAWKGAAPQGDGPAYSSAIRVEVGGVAQYVNFTARGVVGLKADDGAFLWRDDSSANGTANCCAPVAEGGMVFTASGYSKGGALVQLTAADGKVASKFKYHTNKMKVQHGGMILLDGHVYGADENILTCLELATGKVKWQNRSVGKCSLTCADGMLIARSEQGPVALVEATPKAYRELSRFSPKDRSSSNAWTYPVVCGGKLFLRDQDLLQVYEISRE
jgi:outer membrane protein assembly factor BamB